MTPAKAFVVSAAVGVAAVVTAVVAMHSVRLGPAPVRAALAPASAVADRQAKLDRLSAALARARSSKPPRLPAVPRFPHVVIPDRVSLPPVAPVRQVSNLVQPATVAPVKPAAVPQATSPTVTTVVVAPAPPATTTGSDDGSSDDGSGDDG
jgi:hypothetical protein